MTMMTTVVVSESGVRWVVRLMQKGEPVHVGREPCATNYGDEEPLVQFYDASAPPTLFGRFGQYVREYDLKTVLGMDGVGLDLQFGDTDSKWKIDGETMTAVVRWVRWAVALTELAKAAVTLQGSEDETDSAPQGLMAYGLDEACVFSDKVGAWQKADRASKGAVRPARAR